MSNFVKRTLTKTDVGKSQTHRAAIRLPERDALCVFPQHLGKDRPYEFDCEDHTGRLWQFAYTHHRSGPRIRPIEEYLHKYSIRAGDEITLCAPKSAGQPHRIYVDPKYGLSREELGHEGSTQEAVNQASYSEDGSCRYCYSPDERYRYWLEVKLSGKSGVCMFLMLNPSTESGDRERESRHRTREKCKKFAEREGYGTLVICNLFALRTRKPKNLKKCSNPIGPDNDQHIVRKAQESDLIVCAWGNDGTYHDRGHEVLKMLKSVELSQKMRHLGLTVKKQPRHPARIENDAQLQPFE